MSVISSRRIARANQMLLELTRVGKAATGGSASSSGVTTALGGTMATDTQLPPPALPDSSFGATAERAPEPQGCGQRPLPSGYRQGVITAITVFVGFSLAFLRFWAFEAPGDWTPYSIAAVVILLLPICGQIYALYRALQVEDDDERVYRRTIKWFIWSVVGMLVALCVAAVVLSGVFASEAT
jgi:hypothetical protein